MKLRSKANEKGGKKSFRRFTGEAVAGPLEDYQKEKNAGSVCVFICKWVEV